ncbi:hypothetical protein BU14_0381s0001 [Porphyra umbilicalis]|uniref:Uncharacterized protein n=1 Tax=Porphyra umbilicalis TaxID=2786 RepID=A0A1X6NWP7_PORUM|nr:hypothetical protein BU14_0381s0001 [Porphyra umbilicalis]|eukprot:OSX73059.1 hypothetical protein BU14_0381s0001 [Porphyra umbilicalis]
MATTTTTASTVATPTTAIFPPITATLTSSATPTAPVVAVADLPVAMEQGSGRGDVAPLWYTAPARSGDDPFGLAASHSLPQPPAAPHPPAAPRTSKGASGTGLLSAFPAPGYTHSYEPYQWPPPGPPAGGGRGSSTRPPIPPPSASGVKGDVTVGDTEPGSGGSTGSGWAEATAEVRRLGERAAASRAFNAPTGGAGSLDSEPLLFGGGADGAAGLYGRGGHPGGWDGGGRHDAVTELPRLRGLHERDYGRVAVRDPISEPPTENGGGAGDPRDAGASDGTLPPPSSIAPPPPPRRLPARPTVMRRTPRICRQPKCAAAERRATGQAPGGRGLRKRRRPRSLPPPTQPPRTPTRSFGDSWRSCSRPGDSCLRCKQRCHHEDTGGGRGRGRGWRWPGPTSEKRGTPPRRCLGGGARL